MRWKLLGVGNQLEELEDRLRKFFAISILQVQGSAWGHAWGHGRPGRNADGPALAPKGLRARGMAANRSRFLAPPGRGGAVAIVLLLAVVVVVPATADETGPPEPSDPWGPPLPRYEDGRDRIIVSDEAIAKWKDDAAWILAGRALDVGSTEWALSRNPDAMEGNPLMRNRPLRIGGNVAFVAAGAIACRELRKNGRPGWAKWTSRGIFAASLALTVNALIQAQRTPSTGPGFQVSFSW